MNAHSFISHRMFVAAISQESTAESHSRPEAPSSPAFEADARRRGLDFLQGFDLQKPATFSPFSTTIFGQR